MVSGVFALPLTDPVAGPREFLVGEENALVRVALRVVREGESDQLPLVIYGPTGSGKTFLAEGLAEAWKALQPPTKASRRQVLRSSGVDFARAYADACVTDGMSDFRESFETADLLLIEGVHALAEKPRAAREFCLQLDRWLALGKVVIATSLTPPHDLANPSLASRLSAGLTVPLALPAMDTRRRILEQFARERSLRLDDDLLDRLAQQTRGLVGPAPSPRDLQGALLQLESTAKLTGGMIDAPLVESLLSPLPEESIEIRKILAAVARRFGVGVDELRGSSRRQTLVRARGIAIVLARRLTSESLASLGVHLGKRDHSTVHHALVAMEKILAADASLKELVEEIETELTSRRGPTKPAKRSE